ncbi:MAG: helix-turn-helix transcriptional regulator [Ktedonobacteraceae bacterium]|nr:helix-turn-helix transcriptional regulator [Ktedonobacteraceae bacterium]
MKKGEMHPLRIVRLQYNLTIVELAEEAKVGASTIWRAEHDYSINAESRRRLCSYFNRPPDELGLLNHEKQNLTFEQESSTPYAFENVFPPVSVTENMPVVQLLTSSEGSDGQHQHEQSDATSVLEMNSLAALFDANWTPDTMLDALGVVFQGIQLLPARLQHTLLLGMLSITDATTLPIGNHASEEECSQVTEALNTSIAQSRQFCRAASPTQVLIATQGLLYLLRQTRNFLAPESYHSFHEAITNLMGAALFFQEYSDSSRQIPKKVYQVTLERPDIWKQTQSLNQKAVVANASGKQNEAIRFIETALHLLEGHEEKDYQHLHIDRNSLKSFSPVFGQQPSFVDY